MIAPGTPGNEEERLVALESYAIMDTLPEEEYDAITRIASEICGTPISIITLIDGKRQWFKSKVGLEATETPREYAYCAHGILTPDEPLIVNNAFEDERFADNPLATGDPHVEFYAGVPLVTPEGLALGSLCVIDTQPREIAKEKIEVLQILAKQVVSLLELRKTVSELQKTQDQLEKANTHLNEFAHIVAHDLKAPVRNMVLLTEAIQEDIGTKLDNEEKKYLDYLKQSARSAVQMVDGVLAYTKATYQHQIETECFKIPELLETICRQLNLSYGERVRYSGELDEICTARLLVFQVFQNLITNADKYSSNVSDLIIIEANENATHYIFSVRDQGVGIPKAQQQKIFTLFYRTDPQDAQSSTSYGIGLSIVKKNVETLGGELTLESEEGKGSVFTFTVRK